MCGILIDANDAVSAECANAASSSVAKSGTCLGSLKTNDESNAEEVVARSRDIPDKANGSERRTKVRKK
jgi:hypothetical protein